MIPIGRHRTSRATLGAVCRAILAGPATVAATSLSRLTVVAALPPTLLLLVAGCSEDRPSLDSSMQRRAAAIHEAVLSIDTHADIPFDFATAAVDPLDADRQLNLEKMRSGGLDAAFFIVYVGQTERTAQNYAQAQTDAMTKFDAIHRMAQELYPELIELAFTPADAQRIWRSGKLVAAIGIENGYVIGRNLDLLARYHALGARYVTLAHNGHNDIADSAQPRSALGDGPSEHDGISDFGAEVIAEMNRLGIMVDVSHISKTAALEAMELSRAPVIASHSGVRALTDHPRNMDDDTLRALRDSGGVIQIVALDSYVKVQPPERSQAVEALRAELGIESEADVDRLSPAEHGRYERRLAEIDRQWPPADVEDFVDHIDYAVDLIGLDHVGISSDFDGGGGIAGWNDAGETFNVTLELVRRGYTQAQISRLWGGNVLRVWSEAERVAAELRESLPP